MRRAGRFLHDAMQFLQFLHQVVLGVKTACGIDEKVIRFARLRSGDGIVRDGGGIGSCEPAMTGIFRRSPELDCSIAAARKVSHAARIDLSARLNLIASLAAVVVLPVPLTPTIESTVNPGSLWRAALFVARLFQPLLRDGEDIHSAAALSFVSSLDSGDDLRGHGHAEIGADQRGFEFFDARRSHQW